jgi:hypothetical protein
MAEADEKNSDFPMPQYAGGKGRPAPRLLVLHDDAEREFDYTAGAEKSLEQAAAGAERSSASGTTGQPSSPADRSARDGWLP